LQELDEAFGAVGQEQEGGGENVILPTAPKYIHRGDRKIFIRRDIDIHFRSCRNNIHTACGRTAGPEALEVLFEKSLFPPGREST
jgi:hypothetical protein